MPGPVPGIHALLVAIKVRKDVDGRDKPGHDGETNQRLRFIYACLPYGGRGMLLWAARNADDQRSRKSVK